MASETITIEVTDSDGNTLGSMDIDVSTETIINVEALGNS